MSGYVLDHKLLNELRAERTTFGRGSARRKLELLQRCSERRVATAGLLRAYHDHLLFLAAYPDDARVLAIAGRELERVAAAVENIGARSNAPSSLENTGIANTEVVASFSIDLMRWLCRRFPRHVEVAWEDGSLGEPLDDLLPLCVSSPETDGLLGEGPTAEEWFRLAKGDRSESDLRWLLRMLGRLDCSPELLDTIVDRLDLNVRWRLVHRLASLTRVRFPERETFHQRGPLVRSTLLRRRVAAPVPDTHALPVAEARRVIDVARSALALRARETDPVTYANPEEVYLFRLERGIDVAIIGMQPSRRLPIESFFGYVAARNRVPIAYGGGWAFFERVEIGLNVFDQFRGGESSHVFSQVLRVYRHLFEPRAFDVDPYQVGVGNPEGIRSGAFWFYYRHGFRPTGSAERALARSEWLKIRASRAYRCPASILRRVAASPLRLELDRNGGLDDAPNLGDLGRAVTKVVGERWRGDRALAERSAWRDLRERLPLTSASRWSRSEVTAAKRLGVLAAALPDLSRWTESERATLADVLRAKGAPRETEYVARVRQHARLREALARLARG